MTNRPQVLNHNENFTLDNLPRIPPSSPNPLKTSFDWSLAVPAVKGSPGKETCIRWLSYNRLPHQFLGPKRRRDAPPLRRSTVPLQGQYRRKWDPERVANHPGLRAASSWRLPRRRPPALGANPLGKDPNGGGAGRLPVPRWPRARKRQSSGDLAPRAAGAGTATVTAAAAAAAARRGPRRGRAGSLPRWRHRAPGLRRPESGDGGRGAPPPPRPRTLPDAAREPLQPAGGGAARMNVAGRSSRATPPARPRGPG